MDNKKEKELIELVSEQSKKIDSLEKQLKTQNSRFVNMMEKIENFHNTIALLEEILYTVSKQDSMQEETADSKLSLNELVQNRFPFDVN